MTDFISTVSAISTPPGKGGVAVIRITGDSAIEVAEKCFIPRGGKRISELKSAQCIYGDIILDGSKIDDGILTVYRAPNSYTGENTAEISCHGGVHVTQRVLEATFAAGASQASAGEFTKRAFINGKLSLTEAEAVADLLEAKSDTQLKLSSYDSRKRLTGALEKIKDAMLRLISTMYARIDYPDEDLADLSNEEITAELCKILADAKSLKATYKTGKAVSIGINTVICGKPNVGKSSLYNLLCRSDEAIVTEIAGTTRDVLKNTVSVGKVMLNLSDTAGIHKALDPVEKIGVERSIECIDNAELIIAVFDVSSGLEKEDFELIDEIKRLEKNVIAVLNKCDKGISNTSDIIKKEFENTVTISTESGNADVLTELIERLFTDGEIEIGYDAVISTARQNASLVRAISHIENSIEAFSSGLESDIAASDLELAIGDIGELDGRSVNESIVSEIFSHFCVGK